MWLGRKELPDNLRHCIESWKKHCPDYEIIELNEDNYDYMTNNLNITDYTYSIHWFNGG